MRYLIAAHTDVGIKKKTNQDSYMIKEAQTKMGRIFFGVLCDGMGGLSNGELASATVIRAMEQWFETDFPQLLVHTTDAEEVSLTVCGFSVTALRVNVFRQTSVIVKEESCVFTYMQY